MTFIKTQKGLINIKMIVRVCLMEASNEFVRIEYQTAMPMNDESDDWKFCRTVASIGELHKLGLDISDLNCVTVYPEGSR